MKIVVLVRTYNEEANIERFCKAYSFADQILISDFRSTDRTVEIALQFSNVMVRSFFETPEGEFYSHEPKHINQLIDWGIREGADWLIYDDADCAPNDLLQQDIRKIMARPGINRVMLYRLYVYMFDRYFPHMNDPGQSFWAWKPSEISIRADENKDPREQNLQIPPMDDNITILPFPYCDLHFFFRDEAHLAQKLSWYEKKGQPQRHPTEWGLLEPLPTWAKV